MTRRRVLDDDQGAEVARRYEAGETIAELAAAFGVSDGPIRRVIVEAGVPIRRRSHRLLEVDVDEAVRRYQLGESKRQIALALGVGENTIARRLLAAGIQFEGIHERRRKA